MKPSTRIAGVILLCLLPLGAAWAEDGIRALLKEREGKTVTVVLDSGTELTGTVGKIDNGSLKLIQLSGREFYDAVIDLGKVQAVLVRARSS